MHIHPCCRQHDLKSQKPQLLLVGCGGDLASNTLLLHLRHKNCEDRVHQEHLQRSKASGARCKRHRRFRTAAAIKLLVLQRKNQQYTLHGTSSRETTRTNWTVLRGKSRNKKKNVATIGNDCHVRTTKRASLRLAIVIVQQHDGVTLHAVHFIAKVALPVEL